MWELLRSLEFWVAMVFAVLIKLKASPTITLWGSVFTIGIAVTSALLFSDIAVSYLGVSGDTGKAAIAALVALTGEHLARQLLDMDISTMLRVWRGGGSDKK